jgi:glycosyltransferase involved in cell wall biosynthesis
MSQGPVTAAGLESDAALLPPGAPAPFLVLIPAFNPGESLLDTCSQLLVGRVCHIVVVDDGSAGRCQEVFEAVGRDHRCTVLRHAVNLGKGRALKTGLNYAYLHFGGMTGVVTADADGQHACQDILRIGAELAATPGAVIIGSRSFPKDTPARSRIGNLLTRYVFLFLVGRSLSDTQSGLRGIPMRLIPDLLRLDGERYDYEMNMLLLAHDAKLALRETPIATIYLSRNESSHFSPFFDSMKIYFVLLRFAFSSLTTACVDQLIFFLVYRGSGGVAAGMVAARLGSSVVNLLLNRQFVFKSRVELPGVIVRYYSAMAVAGLVAYSMIRMANQAFGWPIITAKVMVESFLFLLSFVVNRDFVFRRNDASGA